MCSFWVGEDVAQAVEAATGVAAHGRGGAVQDLGDRGVVVPLVVAQHEHGPLLRAEGGQRPAHLVADDDDPGRVPVTDLVGYVGDGPFGVAAAAASSR